MDSELNALQEFLESIPQYLGNLEPEDAYLTVQGLPKGVWKALDNYVVEPNEKGDGFNVAGRLAVPILDLIPFSGWQTYRQHNPEVSDEKLYERYLDENPNMVSEFVLEDFIAKFNDFYQDFLNESGISDGSLEIDGNGIRFLDFTKEKELDDGYVDDSDDSVDTEVSEESEAGYED